MNERTGTGGTRQYEQPEADQAERRKVLKQDAQALTYFDIANCNLDTEGRSAIVGTDALGPILPAPSWSRDLAALPPERPLGARVDDLVDMETCWWDPGATGPKGARDDEA